jgi:hypothetical protein
MLVHDIPPPLPVAGSQQRRTRATLSTHHQLDGLISSGLLRPEAREGKKRRNVEFSASTENLGKPNISSPPRPRSVS